VSRMSAPWAAILALVAPAGSASAHAIRTGALRIDETSATSALVRWSTVLPDGSTEVEMPAGCEATPLDEAAGDALRVWNVHCPQGVRGASFAIRGLGPIITEAPLFVRLTDGRTLSHLLTPAAPRWTLPVTQGPLDIARSYVRAGLLHIATGADHVLFLVLLVLLLGRPRAVLLAETAFTASHTIAFSLTSLGWVHVPVAPAEACIALSLVLLALDVKPEPLRDGRRGALAALVFGLVHGLGFAGGLSETGLPDAHAAVALVGFGVGVELGQVAFLGVALALAALARHFSVHRALTVVGATVIGSLSTAWLFQRVLECVKAG
jgi:hypothetical protein